ncbi:MAG: TrbI/VirB10 family protein [Bdellovibrionaceae bacterium]|nr:TrbI/VirB10 family protein [Pseudobdellovibrionaceae bacterium]
MSLEELLKETKDTPTWSLQKKKLTRIILGVLTIILAITAGTLLFVSLKKNKIAHKNDVTALADILKLQLETKKMEEELNRVRKLNSLNNVKSPPNKVYKSISKKAHLAKKTTHTPRIISFDPGTGFLDINIKTKSAYIPTGAVFQARLITPIKTSLEKTFVMAETTHEFRMDLKRRIPKGSRLIGRSRLNPILKGVIVEFDKLVLPDGIETTISGLALSRNAMPEIDGLYFSDDLQNYGTALAFGFLSGFADSARVREPNVFGSQVEVSLSNQVLSGLSTASFQIADDILKDIRERAVEYVVVPAGEPIFVALTQKYELVQRDTQ